MRLTVAPNHDHIRDARQAAYIAAWPITAQLEAHAEAAAGRPEKLEQMKAAFAAIRAAHPIPGDTDVAI